MKARLGIALLAASLLAGCITLEGDSFNILSTDQEIQLGEELSAEVEKDEKVLDNAEVQAYVAGIGERLARVAQRQDVTYAFKVIESDTVNAFALPGGKMYLYSGLLKICENEAELAGVMAHEMGHVSAHHHGESMTRQLGYEMIVGIILGEEPGQAAQVASQLVGQGVHSRFSRANEYEADSLGMEYLFRAGYNPHGMVSFMRKLMAEEQKAGGGNWLPIFATHPPTAERLASLEALAAQYPDDMVKKSPFYTDRYQTEVLAKLK